MAALYLHHAFFGPDPSQPQTGSLPTTTVSTAGDNDHDHDNDYAALPAPAPDSPLRLVGDPLSEAERQFLKGERQTRRQHYWLLARSVLRATLMAWAGYLAARYIHALVVRPRLDPARRWTALADAVLSGAAVLLVPGHWFLKDVVADRHWLSSVLAALPFAIFAAYILPAAANIVLVALQHVEPKGTQCVAGWDVDVTWLPGETCMGGAVWGAMLGGAMARFLLTLGVLILDRTLSRGLKRARWPSRSRASSVYASTRKLTKRRPSDLHHQRRGSTGPFLAESVPPSPSAEAVTWSVQGHGQGQGEREEAESPEPVWAAHFLSAQARERAEMQLELEARREGEPVRIVGGLARRMSTIESVGSREAQSTAASVKWSEDGRGTPRPRWTVSPGQSRRGSVDMLPSSSSRRGSVDAARRGSVELVRWTTPSPGGAAVEDAPRLPYAQQQSMDTG